jgi:hypothetical protein
VKPVLKHVEFAEQFLVVHHVASSGELQRDLQATLFALIFIFQRFSALDL